MNIGATNEYPKGKLNDNDEGELRMAVFVKDKTIIIDFGKKVSWLGLGKEEAIAMSELLQSKSKEL